MTVKLRDIVEALQMMFDETPSFLSLETGEVHAVTLDLLEAAEEADDENEELDGPAWQEAEWMLAKRITFHPDQFRQLPTKSDIDEWQIMKDYADSVGNRAIGAELQDAIRGAGAFRMFKSVIRRRGIEKDWYNFRDRALEQIARDWCEENGISFV
jgi:Uncharacterised protein family (UPF0158)